MSLSRFALPFSFRWLRWSVPLGSVRWRAALLLSAVTASVVWAACEPTVRSATTQGQATTAGTSPLRKEPNVRLYVTSTLAGAMEPCGCRKDMLGGVDHAAALLRKGNNEAPDSLVLAVGPLFFMEPEVTASNGAKDQQDRWKADAIAAAVNKWGLAAWVPGVNDFSRGPEVFNTLRERAGGAVLAANLRADGIQTSATRVVVVGGTKIGLAGVTVLGVKEPLRVPNAPDEPGAKPGTTTAGAAATKLVLSEGDARSALLAALGELSEQDVAAKVALIAAPRGEALRLIEAVSGFDVALVGKPKDSGDSNDAPIPPMLVGNTLVVQGPNHLQAMAVVDLYTRGVKGAPFADGTGIALSERKESLTTRIADLTKRLEEWRVAGKVGAADIEARSKDLAAMEAELASLPSSPPQPSGNFFRYELRQVNEGLGAEPDVFERMRSYYRRVNEHNREAFKDRKPLPPEPGRASFVGELVCETCHVSAADFWKTTRHAHAYRTLASDFKEYNLDCVGCHVTGYEAPGGSTVTFVDNLKDVQCENCHGPGSIHAKEKSKTTITRVPNETLCSKCHHPPHVVDDWDVKQAWGQILGPGHGR
jgi:hypothetical protein